MSSKSPDAFLQRARADVAEAFPGVIQIPQPAAAQFLGVSPRAARQRIKAGKPLFPCAIREAGRYYITADELIQRLAERLARAGCAK